MAIYYVYSGAGGSNNGSSWANAFTTLTTAFATEAAGDTLYVAHDHSEVGASGVAINLASSTTTAGNPTKIICVNRTGSVPPVSADRRATAQLQTTGTASISFSGTAHYDGIIFIASSAASASDIVIISAASTLIRFDNCSLRLNSTNISNKIQLNHGASVVEFNNTTVSFAAVDQRITVAGTLRWRNTLSALLGTIPTTLFLPLSGSGGAIECIGVDFSAAGSGKTIMGTLATGESFQCRFVDCKLNASVTKSAVPLWFGANEVDFIRSGSSGVNYAVHSHRTSGLLIEETTIIRTGGASDGTTPIAWKIVTTASCSYSIPFECPPIAIWNDTIGSSITATVEGIWGGGAVPNDDEIWLELEYLGDASSPQGSFVNDGKADLIATATGQTSSSETWGGSTTKFKLNVAFTPQQKGWIYARVKIGKLSSTFYVDPLVTLT